jgi:hypothetical protein
MSFSSPDEPHVDPQQPTADAPLRRFDRAAFESLASREAGKGRVSEDEALDDARPIARDRERRGDTTLELRAAYKFVRDLPALEPSSVVAALLWPQTMAQWAAEAKIAPAMLYNCLSRKSTFLMPGSASGRRVYGPVRDKLAARLQVSRGEIDALLDRRPAVHQGHQIVDAPALWAGTVRGIIQAASAMAPRPDGATLQGFTRTGAADDDEVAPDAPRARVHRRQDEEELF